MSDRFPVSEVRVILEMDTPVGTVNAVAACDPEVIDSADNLAEIVRFMYPELDTLLDPEEFLYALLRGEGVKRVYTREDQ